MRFFLLSDNIDTQIGMRLVGIDGIVVHERDVLLTELGKAMANPEIGIILMTTRLIDLCPSIISELKLRQSDKLIVEIPDRRFSGNFGSSIEKYVSEAIGVKL
ncbi:MAG: V-type ATP synthase subunit F [Candidatus Izemoplasmatales bacterium]|jgi:V/A-type H+-transporting ATPase subunit F|nr:V-type ATP synthase subunit F [Candidatus Izemoplasmatales bacterium]MDD3865918.1 V-type ATP synthase subunit F [Candidatus Izemoplasmatales bacterium]